MNEKSKFENPSKAGRPKEGKKSEVGSPKSAEQKITPTATPQSQTMEVHHHPQLEHKPKPWKEYLLEGLMIFVAVTMGFFAESLREHITDNEREEQYVRSMIADLKDDKQKLKITMKDLGASQIMLDSLITILNDRAAMPRRGDDLYYYGRLGPRIATVTINMRTYEQLKNSGSFRLISKAGISNEIMAYYQKIPFMQQIEGLYLEEFASYKKVAANVFDPAVFARQETKKGDIIKGRSNPPLQKGALSSVSQLAVFAIYMNGSRKQILANDEDMLKSADELLASLQKAYHLEDE